MQIVTDSGTDVHLPQDQLKALKIHVVPLVVTLGGKSYKEGVDIQADKFYPMLEATDELPVTSQPSAGDFAKIYTELAKTDPEILSIHISSGLSGTFASATAGAALVPEAKVTVVDTKTLSAPAGWQVEAAARCAKAGWSKAQIMESIHKIGDATDVIYTLKELKYLIHGGRISHMKGLVASLLNIKPMIGVEKVKGTYVQHGMARSFAGAVRGLSEYAAKKFPEGSALRVQVLHSYNPEGAQMLVDEMNKRFKCNWLPTGLLSLVLGAHVGPSMVGVVFAPEEVFAGLPS
ncbi:MAG: DegV family protein [Chloroflexi bacterium]|nr:MAG: DegV family protein [Chloroflexota bacterium]